MTLCDELSDLIARRHRSGARVTDERVRAMIARELRTLTAVADTLETQTREAATHLNHLQTKCLMLEAICLIHGIYDLEERWLCQHPATLQDTAMLFMRNSIAELPIGHRDVPLVHPHNPHDDTPTPVMPSLLY